MRKQTLLPIILALMVGYQLPVYAMVKESPTQHQSGKYQKTQVSEGKSVPDSAYADLQTLVDLGKVKLPAGVPNVQAGHFTRNEMTILTLQAIDALDARGVEINGLNQEIFLRKQGAKEVMDLKKEFATDLHNYGMRMANVAESLKASSEASDLKRDEERKWKLSGELRYNYDHNYGADRYQWNDSRLRARLYVEAKINDDWHAFGMLEWNKHFLSQHDSDDDWTERTRFYVRGLTGITILTAGRYGYNLGEGNIYDSSVTGVTANVGSPVNYEFTAARTEASGNMLVANATYKADRMEYGGGYAKFGDDDWGTGDKQILHAYANYRVGKFTTGLMGLHSDKEDKDGRKNGFVLSGQYGRLQSWKPGSMEFDVKYYRQPLGTYVCHTMTGLAGYMEGFKGPGFMYYYTLLPNVVYGFEYYDLDNLETNEKGRTIWNQVNWFF
jgi:hypothetical protein